MLRALSLVPMLMTLCVAEAQAGGCCASCGCHNLKKVCKPVCDVVKETKFVYDCVCEDFCVPGPSRIVGHTCKKDCSGCERCCPVRQPTCAAVRTRTKLVKTAVEVEKPTIRWVVQTVCCGCGAVCGNGGCAQGCADGSCTHGCANVGPAAADATAIPPPPVPEQPSPPSLPTPAREASFAPQPGALIDILSGEQR